MTKRVAVLGANSFSGQDFVTHLLDKGDYEILGTSRSPERSKLFLSYLGHKNVGRYRYQQLDMNRDNDKLLAVLDDFEPHYIVNFAAQSEVAPSWDHPEHWFATNTVALASLVNHLRRKKYLERYLHVSSPEAYGSCVGNVVETSPLNPSTPYAASKAAADMLLNVYWKQFGFPLLTVRATNVYGSRQQLFKIIPRTAIYLSLGKTIELHGGGVAQKSYIHIRDVSRGELAILERGRLGELYHLSPDGAVAIRSVVESMCKLMDKPFDSSVEMTAERPGQDALYLIDSTKARTELGWRTEVSLEDGLREVVEWVRGNLEEIKKQPLVYQHQP